MPYQHELFRLTLIPSLSHEIRSHSFLKHFLVMLYSSLKCPRETAYIDSGMGMKFILDSTRTNLPNKIE
jgi:hypothetical protein